MGVSNDVIAESEEIQFQLLYVLCFTVAIERDFTSYKRDENVRIRRAGDFQTPVSRC